jgi:hypothetical protein
MTRPIDAQDILAALPPEARDDFKQQIKQQGGVEVTFTVSKAGHKRKHRWASAKGHVVAVRFTDEQYAIVSSRAADNGRSPGEYLKWLGHQDQANDKPKAVTSTEKQKKPLSRQARLAQAGDLMENAKGITETLLEEISTWHDNLEGTNLENTSKYQELQSAAEALQEVIDQIDEANAACQGVQFPTPYR